MFNAILAGRSRAVTVHISYGVVTDTTFGPLAGMEVNASDLWIKAPAGFILKVYLWRLNSTIF